MLEIFFQILQRLPTIKSSTSSNNHFGYATSFKVQVNFYILIFEGHIDGNDMKKWLNLLEVYFSIHNFSDRENITFTLLKDIPHVKHWWDTYWEKNSIEEFGIF
jgi:hypothetical protein